MQKTLLASSSAAVAARAENPQPLRLEGVDDARRQGGFGTDHGQPHLVLLGKPDQGREIGRLDSDVLAVQIGAGVARGHENAVGTRALRNLPRQGVLPPAAADDQDVHTAILPAATGIGRLYPHAPVSERGRRRFSRACRPAKPSVA